MDRSRVLRLARDKQLKKNVAALGDAVPSIVPPKTTGSAGGASLRPEAVIQAGAQVEGPLTKKPKLGGSSRTLKLVDEPEEVVDLTDLSVGENLAEGGTMTERVKGLENFGVGGSPGTERCTILKFHSRQGWLGSGAGAPLEALGAFTLSPDRKKLGELKGEEVQQKTKEVLGQLGTYVLDLIDRSSKDQERAQWELAQAVSEKEAKERALQKVEEAAEREERLTKDLSSRDEDLRASKAQLAVVANALETERASAASLQTEVDRLRQECQKASESLEKVEKDALITYNDCVEKFKESPEFEDIIYEKAGDFHSGGFQDCLKFVGYGNVLDPEKHTLALFHQSELASLAPNDPEGVTVEGTRGSGDQAVGAELQPEGSDGKPKGSDEPSGSVVAAQP